MSSDLATLKLKVDVQRRLIAMLSLRRVWQTFDAAHLLAHQQARGIEAREEEAQGITDYLDLRDHADALAVDLADYRRRERDYRAENERLRGVLRDVARCGLGLDLFDVDLADRIRTALGEEAGNA